VKQISTVKFLNTDGLALTGERTVPGVPSENYWFRRHQAAYLHLREQVLGPRLLEVGAGEGYGAALLAERVPGVLALDYDAAAIGHLARHYPSLAAVRANLAALPVRDASIDTVVSLQVIEHVWDHPQFVAECARVLRPGGLLMLSTPNRLTFSPGAGKADRPVNPFHTHEFTAAELRRLVADSGLSVTALRGVHAGPRLAELDRRYRAQGGLAAAQLAEPPERWPAELAADVASIDWQDFVISDDVQANLEALDGSLDLLLVARAGDRRP
jgi:2-polyprenyl-3-methyl-5-hydroxy-6-metoxy-1,4-benzoquinol methylase